MRYELSEIPRGAAGTDRTVQEILRHVKDDLKRPQLRALATQILNESFIRAKNQKDEALALYDFVVSTVRYQKDPIGIETVQSPLATVKIGAGDCDDQVGLMAGLALSVGIPVRLRVVGYSPENFIHIFCELLIDGEWLAADTTEPNRGLGWRPYRFPVEKTYNITREVSNMAEAASPLVTRGELKQEIKKEVKRVLWANWRSGLINKADVQGYLRVIADKNFPSRKPLLVDPTREAIEEFLDKVEVDRIGSVKPEGFLSGLEDLEGFLKSIWNGVKKAVKKVAGTALSVIPGGGIVKGAISAGYQLLKGGQAAAPAQPLLQVRPTVQIPEQAIQTQLAPGAARAFGAGMFGTQSMLPWLLGGALALVLILKK